MPRFGDDMPIPRGNLSSFDHNDDPSDASLSSHLPDAKVDLPRIEKAVREILLAIGEDPDREGLQRTPNRVARAYAELLAGLQDDPKRYLKTVFTARYA